MKRTLLGVVLGITASILSAHGQGWVFLDNYNSPATAITYGAGSGGTPGTVINTSFKVGVYWAAGTVTVTNDPTGIADPATLGPLTLGTGPGSETPVFDGLFESITPFTMTPLTNGPATLVIVAYNGSSYATSTVRGHSSAFQITTTQAPNIPPTVGNVMSSFAVYSNTIVPPPSGVAILAGPLTNSANSSIYFLLGNSTWTDAEAKAVQLGGHLVTINNSIENDWVVSTFANYAGTPRSLWVGINDAAAEGTFVWSSGEPVSYNLWNYDEPNGSAGGGEDYAYIYGPMPSYPYLLGHWNDISNVTVPGGVEPPLHGVVEIPSSNPPPAGVVVLAGPVTNSANGHKYYLLSGNTWTAAEAKAVQLGGHLVSVNDAAENAWVVTNFASFGGTPRSLLIGINDAAQEGTFVWSSGDPVTYNNWNSGEPNGSGGAGEDYAYMYGPMPEYPSLLGRWNDIKNVSIPGGVEPALYGVVEVASTNPPPSGIVVLTGPVTNSASGHAYLLLSGSTWTEAEAKAIELGGHLVTINDAAENDWVFTNFSSFGGTNRHLWIGLNDEAQEGTFVWSSGDPVGFTFWYPGEPNNSSNDDYAHIWAPDQPDANRRWNDIFIISVDEIGRPFCGVVEKAVAAPPLGPTITQHPTNRTVNAGSPTTFAAAATGTSPLAYQWRRNGTNIAGATNINYSIGSVQANHAGLYTLRVTNLFGAAISSNAQLTVVSPPAFTQQPTNRTVIAGSPTTFNAAVTGTSPLAYQWRLNGVNITNATNVTYSIAAAQTNHAGLYTLRVTNLFGAIESSDALLTVLPPPPVPVIYSFAPIKASAGDAVQLVGTNFSSVPSNNIVYFGPVRALVVAASPTNLTVVTPSGATFAPPSVTVAGLSAQANTPFLPTYMGAGVITDSSFAPKVDFTATTRQATVAAGDLDGDGKPDLMVANNDSSTVSVYRNISSNGVINATSFAPRISFTTGTSPYAWLADVDGDGKLDILVANNGGGSGNTISILRNTSTPGVLTNSSFAARVNFTTATGPLKIEAGDLDGDGKTDLAVCAANSRVVSILRNIGAPGIINSNSFSPRVDIAATVADRDVKMADLDDDGKLDLVVANFTGGSVSVLRNIATRGSLTTNSFAPRVTLTTGSVYNIAVGDLDGDGKLDLAVDNRPSSIGVLRNLSTPGNLSSNTFAAKVSFPVDGEPYMVAIGDVDGDGKPDLAASVMNSNAVAVLRNTAAPGTINSNSFAARVLFATGNSPRNTVLGDLDADGRPDLAVANLSSSFISVLKNTAQYAQPPTLVEVTPTNLVVNEGQDAVFTVTAQGTDPIYYQWLFADSPLADATNAVLNLTNVQYAQAGLYSVIASNSIGVATSSNAVLIVNRLPIANADATAKLIISPNGSNAVAVLDGSLSSDPDGDALTYTWFLTGETNAFESGVVALSTLPVGSNQLTLVVNDGMALGSQAFAVEVITTSEAVDRLMALVQSGSGNTQPLITSLRAALASIDRSHPETAINQLEAFKNKVLAQVAPTDPALANQLLADAQAIIDALNGGTSTAAVALEITSISQGNNGKPHLKIKGAAGHVHIVETSTDMVNWTKIGVAGCCGGCDYEFDDAQTSPTGARYYRVVSPK